MLIEVLPEIGEIHDRELREKVVSCWEDAITSGGWRPEDLKRIPFALSLDECLVNLADHVRAVTQVCMAAHTIMTKIYGKKVDIHRDYLLAGALLHDIGKLLETTESEAGFCKSRAGELIRHPISGAILCARHGIPDEIIHIIATHSKEGEGSRKTAEAKILFHADFMNFEIQTNS